MIGMKSNYLSGQVFGRVDWISKDSKECGTYVYVRGGGSFKCAVSGPHIEKALANNLIKLGAALTASGEVYARITGGKNPDGSPTAEMVVEAERFLVEPSNVRTRGSMHVIVKGVAKWVNEYRDVVKAFINSNKSDRPSQLTFTVDLAPYIRSMSPEGADRFRAMLTKDREFTLSAPAVVSGYMSNGRAVPSIQVAPLDFKLQG